MLIALEAQSMKFSGIFHKYLIYRTLNKTLFCGIGAGIQVAHSGLHFGEEPPISGMNGSGINRTLTKVEYDGILNYALSKSNSMKNSFF